MKKYFISVLFVVFRVMCNAQAPTFQWAKQMGGNSFDEAKCVKVDNLGNVYTIGCFRDTVDFDPGVGFCNLFSLGNADIFISKLDGLGNFVWAKRIGGALYDCGFSISIDVAGNIYVTGSYQGIVDFDPGALSYNLSSSGGDDVFVLKLDSNGNFVWARSMGGTIADFAFFIGLDLNGNIYSVGNFSGISDFDPGIGVFNLTAPGGSSDIFISKLNSSGDFVWAKQIEGNSIVEGYAGAIDSLGNIYITGYNSGLTDFDPSVGTYNLNSIDNDIFVSKIDSAGSFVWAKLMGGLDSDYGYSIVVDDFGNVYTTGNFYGTADFDPNAGIYNLTAVAGVDVFISKLDVSGDFVWAKQLGGNSDDFAWSITTDLNNDIYTTGEYAGTADFDPSIGVFNLMSPSSRNVFISKLSSLGDFIWAKEVGGLGTDIGRSIEVNSIGDVYTVGDFDGIGDYDPDGSVFNLSTDGYSDVFVQKMSQPLLSVQEFNSNNNSIFLYPNPTTNNLTIETTKPTTILIVDLLGQELYNSKIEKSETIDVSFLANGIYFVKDLKNGGSVKFAKQ